MTELEVTILTQIDATTSFSATFKHIATDEHEAADLGASDRRLLDAYLAGYGATSEG